MNRKQSLQLYFILTLLPSVLSFMSGLWFPGNPTLGITTIVLLVVLLYTMYQGNPPAGKTEGK